MFLNIYLSVAQPVMEFTSSFGIVPLTQTRFFNLFVVPLLKQLLGRCGAPHQPSNPIWQIAKSSGSACTTGIVRKAENIHGFYIEVI